MKLTITRQIATLFLLPAVGAVGALAAFSSYHARSATDVVAIEAASRQQLYSHQLGTYTHMVYEMAHHEEERRLLRDHLEVFEESLEVLETGGRIMGRKLPPPPAEVVEEIREVRRLWDGLKVQAQIVSRLPVEDPRAGDAYARVRSGVPVLIEAAHGVTVALDGWGRGLKERMLYLLVAMAGFDLILLLAGVWIMRRYVAERNETEEEMRTLTSAIEQTADGVMITGTDGVIEYVNPAFVDITGYPPKEVVGRTPGLLRSGEHDARFYEEFWQSILCGKVHRSTFINKKKSGEVYYAEKTVTPVRGTDGDVTHFVSTDRDITEKRRAEERLKGSLAERGLLLKEVYHRVKNNLQIVVSLLQRQAEACTDERARQTLTATQQQVYSMALVHQQLYQSADLAEIGMESYVRELTASLMQAWDVAPDRVSVSLAVDEIRMNLSTAIPCGLIINELVTNALKHAFPRDRVGEVMVALRVRGEGLELVVRDNGAGLPDETDGDRSPSLGVRLVQDLTYQLGGTLEVTRSGGTTWRMAFPVGEDSSGGGGNGKSQDSDRRG